MSLVSGTDGDDTVSFTPDSFLLAGPGNDMVTSSIENAVVRLCDGDGTNMSDANGGNVHGGIGNDTIAYGGAGEDTLVAECGSGNHVFHGGRGYDSYEVGGDHVFVGTAHEVLL
ncbi:hypothetical protein [Shimia abyssi]|uniref:Hemolysin type calcium-binding protein n=1 Tax=Shimia abyssi TaxID=1662395 RepID=A0A2P8F7M8_9RHOB|nr:hypothetical protein [Shimia abyssi]PSL17682.1 hypothetical protein CLV88_11529 [Shimia abyssi]